MLDACLAADDAYHMLCCAPLADPNLSVSDEFDEACRWRALPSHKHSALADRRRRVLEHYAPGLVYEGDVAWAPDEDDWVPHGRGALHDTITGVVRTATKSGCFTRGVPGGIFDVVFPDGTRYMVKYDHGKVSFGEAVFATGLKYFGQLSENFELTGFGTMFFPEYNARCKGTFNGGLRMAGFFVTEFPDKTVVEAEFRDNKIVHGRVTYADGTVYKGELTGERTPHGAGRVYDPEDKTWESGSFEHGVREGVFVKRTSEDVLVSTTYRGDELVYGRFEYPSGAVREGQILGGKLHGQGRYAAPGGSQVFEGQFVRNLLCGPGKEYLDGQVVYEGEFQNDARHGKGKLTLACGGFVVGEFRNGEPHGRVHEVRIEPHGTRVQYKGEVLRGKWAGVGVLTDVCGVYSGRFVDGKRHGCGCQVAPSGRKVFGEWQHGAFLGAM